MTSMKKHNANDVGRMIRTLGLLAFAIILKSHETNTFSLFGSMVMIAVVAIVVAINAYGSAQKRIGAK
jgi:hypothetical protein